MATDAADDGHPPLYPWARPGAGGDGNSRICVLITASIAQGLAFFDAVLVL